jgi:hypothetical protein
MTDHEKYPTIDCFETDDGRTFETRVKRQALPKLPGGMYQLKTSMQGWYFVKQALPDSPILALDIDQTAILWDVDLFWNSATKYAEFGFPHKRGVLLYGPPGTGKTTTVRAIIADVVRRGGIALEMSSPGLVEMALDSFRQVQPDTPVLVVMEELDAWMGRFENEIVNLLDGLQRVDHIMFLATTNHLKRIPEKLKSRPSRFDVVKAIGYPQDDARRNYIVGVVKKTASTAEIEGLVEQTKGMSIAHVKEVLLRTKIYGLPDDLLDLFRGQCKFPTEGFLIDDDRGEGST